MQTPYASFTFSILVIALALSCEPAIHGSTVATGATPPAYSASTPMSPATVFTISSLALPARAEPVGMVQVHSNAPEIPRLLPELMGQVQALGGNHLKIDDITTTYEVHSHTRVETYSCGTAQSPMTCSRVVTTPVEIPTTRVLGRAFRVPK